MSVLVTWLHIKPDEHPAVRVTPAGTVEIRLDDAAQPGSDAAVVAFLDAGILDPEAIDAYLEQLILQAQSAREQLQIRAFNAATGYEVQR